MVRALGLVVHSQASRPIGPIQVPWETIGSRREKGIKKKRAVGASKVRVRLEGNKY